MARMFSGTYDLKVDPKGRVSIPAAFRKLVEAADPDFDSKDSRSRAMLPVGYGLAEKGFLEAFSAETLDQMHRDIEAMPRGSRNRFGLSHLYHARLQELQIDETGRISLPPAWRTEMGVTDMVRFVGYGNKFEIWDPATYDRVRGAKSQVILDGLGDDLDPSSLFDLSEDA